MLAVGISVPEVARTAAEMPAPNLLFMDFNRPFRAAFSLQLHGCFFPGFHSGFSAGLSRKVLKALLGLMQLQPASGWKDLGNAADKNGEW